MQYGPKNVHNLFEHLFLIYKSKYLRFYDFDMSATLLRKSKQMFKT